jgi:hypothetical protein
VDKDGPLPDPATGVKSKCWLWLGSVSDQGYGRFTAAGKRYQVSRYAWQEMGMPDPGALTVSTRCRNKLCVRHLYTRTRAEIMASVPRRWASGEDSHLARATSKQVLLMRRVYAKGNVTEDHAGRAIRLIPIKREEHPGPSLLETDLAPLPAPRLRILEAHRHGLREPVDGRLLAGGEPG